jgi:hypothetical protein
MMVITSEANKKGLRRLPSRFNPGFKKPVVEGRAINIREMVVAGGLRQESDDQIGGGLRRAVKSSR